MKLMVLDGNSIVNRAFYGVHSMLKTRDGLYTNAIFGFLNILFRLLDEEQPQALCVTFDLHAPTFRHKAYADYKAGRHPMPDELRMQIPVLKEVLDQMNIPRYEKEGYEADDLIGTISRRCEAEDWDCVIVTGDKDSLQLITEHTMVKLVSTAMGKSTTKDMTPAVFFESYGFTPPRMVDLKALMGDASDHLSGVPGIGEKTALDLIRKYDTVDAIYQALPELDAKPGVIKKLTEGEAQARETFYLATIVTDVPDFPFDPDRNLCQPPKNGLYDLFLRLEFSKLIDKMGLTQSGAAEKTAEQLDYAVSLIEDENTFARAFDEWTKAPRVAVLALPGLGGVCVCNGGAAAVLLQNRYAGDYNAALCRLFSSDVNKTTHELKELQRALLADGLPLDGFSFDTALAAYLLDATQGSYDLPRLAVADLDLQILPPVYAQEDAFSMLGDMDAALQALGQHTAVIEALSGKYAPQIEEKKMNDLLADIELPLCCVLAEMERNGCRVDAAELQRYGEMLKGEIAACEEKIYQAAGQNFNINSPKQLGEILFERMQIPPVKKTKSGYSTNAEVLEQLRGAYPIVDEVLRYRQYTKLKSTYADGLLKELGSDGRIHTTFQMTVTATGRLSSTEPNLQNIPTRTELGSEIRRMFTAAPGCILVDADYSQIELRLLAHISDDKVMQQAFLDGEDIHTATASHVFGVPAEEVTPLMRRRAKAVNFGIVYGISPFSLAKDIGVSQWEAKEYIETYLKKYSGVKSYMERIVEQAKTAGYVETLYHRRRELPELRSSNFNLRSFGERVALNMPIQGTAADLMKLAMVRVYRRLKKEQSAARMVLQIHDELLVECPEGDAAAVGRILEEEMSGAAKLSVPLIAQAHSGKNWLEAK